MSLVAIVFHSGYGHTKVLADHLAQGVGTVPGSRAVLVPVDKVAEHWADLDAADGLIFGSPTYMGAATAAFRTFAEATSGRWAKRAWADKVAGGFTNSASPIGDKGNTMVEIATLAAQHGMIWVSLDLPPGGNASTSTPDNLNRLGGSLGVYAQANADQGPDVAPIASDRRTAEHYGARVARIAQALARGRA